MFLVLTLGYRHRCSFQQEAFKRMTSGLPSGGSKYPTVTASSVLFGPARSLPGRRQSGARLEDGERRDAVMLALFEV